MTPLTALIDAFLDTYPDDADLEWMDRPRKPAGTRVVLDVMVGDLIDAHRRAAS